MARRRKSSKSSDAAGVMLLLFIGAAAAASDYVATHSVEIAVVAGGIGTVWLVARLARSKPKTSGLSPVNSVAAQPSTPASPSSAGAALRSTNFAIKSGASAPFPSKPDQASDPFVRITPIVDSPSSEDAPAKSWFWRDRSEANVGKAKWVRPGETVNVQGIEISSGWFYLGTDMPAEYSGNEPCLINPKLPISKGKSQSTSNDSYNPSYSDFKPSQRRAFLEWMAGGRRNPDADASLVQIFLGGLEYRLFKQGEKSKVADLVEEAERLFALYGTENSLLWRFPQFLGYANALLPNPKRPDPRFAKVADEFSLHVRVFIGGKLARGEPIAAEDALVWAFALPNVWLRTPATRCTDEFSTLWSMRFADKYRGGFAVAMPKTRISAAYRACFGGFQVPLHGNFQRLPDIASDEHTALELKALVEDCTNELDAYSRLLGRHPELAGTPQASILLPEDLWIGKYGHSIEKMAAMLGENEILVTRFEDLMTAAEFSLEGASGKELVAALDRLSLSLRRFGVGVEPNGSHAEASLSSDSAVSLFRIGGNADGLENGDPKGWRTAIDVALLAAGTAGPVSDVARGAAANAIAADFAGLDPMRITAYAASAEPAASRLGKLLKTAGGQPLVERRSIARCAVSTALALGVVPPATVKFLERLYGALQFPVSDLYAALHRGDADRPSAGSTPQEVGVDANRKQLEGRGPGPAPRAGEVLIDIEKLKRAREATHAVSKILADVFTDDQSASPAPEAESPDRQTATNCFGLPGLDAAHATLLWIVVDNGSLERKAFEASAKELKLMADGAIERINDWAFDRFDEPLIEDGGVVTTVAHLRDRVNELRDREQ
jgi:hypothetical protein